MINKNARPIFPFNAIVGQDELKEALLVAAVDRTIGGVLILGDRGTGKSTAIRALANLLPERSVVAGCAYGCSAGAPANVPGCAACTNDAPTTATTRPVPMVDLPLGASEDRITGAMDIERAMTDGVSEFEPGLLARANGGFLYIDEVNLLEDHLVDLLLDAAASGENVVERESISIRHPAEFVLVGSGNPEEGELRPQMLDRFGLAIHVNTPTDIDKRVQIVKRRNEFDQDPHALIEQFRESDEQTKLHIEEARARVEKIEVSDALMRQAAALCVAVGTDGLRGELTLVRAARAHAALESASTVTESHLYKVAIPALRHRLRKDPLDDTSSDARIERAVAELFGTIE